MQTYDAVGVLQAALQGDRPMDEEAQRSLAVLEERLEQLKRQHVCFEGVCFSKSIERLTGRSAAIAVY